MLFRFAPSDFSVRFFADFLKDPSKRPHTFMILVTVGNMKSSSKNCCKEMSPTLDKEDVKTLAKALHLTQEEFKEKYVLTDDEEEGCCFKTKPCPFLGVDGCLYYEYRPKDCRSYPHLHKENFVFRLMGVIENCSICPIVFNVYESLKKKLWHR